MSSREFPFSPRSATRLEVGDVLAIPCEDGTWAVLKVSALRRTGPGARTTFGVGVLPWRGQEPPTAADVAGLEFVAHGLTGIEICSIGGAEVVTNTTLAGGVQANMHDSSFGTRHSTWGWRAAMERAQAAAATTWRSTHLAARRWLDLLAAGGL